MENMKNGLTNDKKISYHQEMAPNFQKACDQMLDWLKSNELKREQIISITTHESLIENGDAILVCVYKIEQEHGMTSLAGLKFHLLKNLQDW